MESRLSLWPKRLVNYHFVQPKTITPGVGTVLNRECYINAQGGVKFVKFCHIENILTVYSSNHSCKSIDSIPYGKDDILKTVDIGDCVWIGANLSILPGPAIGDGAIISVGAVVRGVP
ncbi:MAG: hypothetical protein IPP74_15020 [Alphaproteobacteria bacterium]|nr:hypothetical protein [Alphaproteobacteria bacterium]